MQLNQRRSRDARRLSAASSGRLNAGVCASRENQTSGYLPLYLVHNKFHPTVGEPPLHVLIQFGRHWAKQPCQRRRRGVAVHAASERASRPRAPGCVVSGCGPWQGRRAARKQQSPAILRLQCSPKVRVEHTDLAVTGAVRAWHPLGLGNMHCRSEGQSVTGIGLPAQPIFTFFVGDASGPASAEPVDHCSRSPVFRRPLLASSPDAPRPSSHPFSADTHVFSLAVSDAFSQAFPIPTPRGKPSPHRCA
jgi:hypothetical protein